MQEIRFDDMPFGGAMRGVASPAGPELELGFVDIEMPDGTYARSAVWRSAPAPETPAADQPAPETAADADAS